MFTKLISCKLNYLIMHKLYLCLSLLISITTSCNTDSDYNSDNLLKAFNLLSPEERIWAHKVNSLDLIKERVSDFKGIEVDIFYNQEKDNFEIKHEIETSGIDLECFLDSILQVKDLYFWFDYKNLNTNTDSGISKLYSILSERELEKKSFIESYFAKKLDGFKGKLATSFWLSIIDIPEEKSERDKLYQKKYKYIEDYNITMLSANFRMYEFITEYFPNYKCNYWIFNELTDHKAANLKKLIASPNVNVIIIDGNKNPLK